MTAPAHMTTLVPEGTGPFMTAFVSTLLAKDLASGAVGGRRSFKLAVVDRIADIEAGYDLVLLAGELGCATTTIKRIVQDLDIRRPRKAKKIRERKPSRRRLPPVAEIIADIRLGASVALIAEDAGTSKQAVYRELARNGFRLNAGNIDVAPYADTPEAFTARLEAVAAIEAQVAEIIARRTA